MTLAELRTAVRAYLGVSDTDRAFTNTRLTRWLNDALNELRFDSPKSYFQQRATWAADSSTSHVYTLASQSPAVTALQSIIELRLDSTTGAKLREVSFEQLPAWAGLAYAVTGADEAATVTTNEDTPAGATLYVVYEAWPSELSGDSDTPSWLPARFHDVPALMATQMAFASGGEGRMPDEYARKLMDRRAELLTHQRRRSVDAMLTRAVEGATLT